MVDEARHVTNAQYLQPHNKPLFDYFAEAIPSFDWNRRTVLDFGCNVGNLYLHAAGRIKNYIGLDIQHKSLEVARSRYPEARWIHHNRFHPSYNVHGVADLALQLDTKVDLIVAYSVFSHCSLQELRASLAQFHQWLNPGGFVLFSVWEAADLPHWLAYLGDPQPLARQAATTEWGKSLYLIDRQRIVRDRLDFVERCDFFDTFYRKSFLLSEEGISAVNPTQLVADNGFPLQPLLKYTP